MHLINTILALPMSYCRASLLYWGYIVTPILMPSLFFMQKYRLYSQIKSFIAVFPSMGAYTSVQNVQNVPSFCVIAIDNAQRPKF